MTRTPDEQAIAETARVLYEADQAGMGPVASLRPGDRFKTGGEWFTVVKIQGDGSERKLGPYNKERTCYIHCDNEAGERKYLIRRVFHLYPVEYTDEHAAEMLAADQEGMWP